MKESDMLVSDIGPDANAVYCRSDKKNDTVIIIIPGGGYDHVSGREGLPVAERFTGYGHDTMVLKYSVAPYRFPTQIGEIAKCFDYLKDKGYKKKILLGFSAGGHLAASYSAFWKEMFDEEHYRPDGQILCYPVITSGEYSHRESFDNLLGKDADASLKNRLSLEKSITPFIPKTFIWHSVNDESVPCENSLIYARALKSAGIPVSLHLFSDGRHGISLGTKESARDEKDICPECAQWTQLADRWIKQV